MTTAGIRQQVVVGAGWMVLLRFTDRAIGLVSIAILARLLVPEDFGLVALAMSFIAILDMIGELSVELVLIQNQTAGRPHYDTAWTLNIIKGVVLAGFLVLLAPPAASFFSEPQVAPILYWLAFTVAIGGFENIGIVDFRKHLEFHREYVLVMASRVAATAITIAAAIGWPGPGALVAGMVARRVVALALSYVLHGYRPRLSLEAFREVFRFSKWVMLENLLGGLRQRSHNFILGRMVGAQALGLYSMAYEIAMMASSEIEQPIRRAVFPGYAKVASDAALLRRAFLDVLGMIAVLAAPLAVGVGLIANLVVPLLLGAKWLETIPLIQILSLFGLMVVMGGGTRLVYLAANKPHLATMLSAVEAGVLVPFVVVGAVTAGSIGVAWGMVVAATLTWLTAMVIVTRLLRIELRQVASPLSRIAIALLGMALSVWSLQTHWNIGAGDGVMALGMLLVACVIFGAIVYTGLLFVAWWVCGRPAGPESHLQAAGQAALQRVTAGRWGSKSVDIVSDIRRQ